MERCLIFASILFITSLYKTIAAALVLLAVLAQTFSRILIVADYYANTQAYAKNCENKAKPQMHCNGKCQMMKKIKAAEKPSQGGSERKANSKSDMPFFVQAHPAVEAAIVYGPLAPTYRNYQHNATVDRNGDIFHPPKA